MQPRSIPSPFPHPNCQVLRFKSISGLAGVWGGTSNWRNQTGIARPGMRQSGKRIHATTGRGNEWRFAISQSIGESSKFTKYITWKVRSNRVARWFTTLRSIITTKSLTGPRRYNNNNTIIKAWPIRLFSNVQKARPKIIGYHIPHKFPMLQGSIQLILQQKWPIFHGILDNATVRIQLIKSWLWNFQPKNPFKNRPSADTWEKISIFKVSEWYGLGRTKEHLLK